MSDIYTIAKSGLKAYKEGLATTGQNIANVGNEAYSRREASISEVKSGSPDVLQLSENLSFGVKVDGITRAFDQFIDIQLQNAKSNFSFSQAQTQVYNQLENIARPDTGSVSQRINEFFAALSTVAQDPSDIAARYGAVDTAKAITNSFVTVAKGINDLKSFVGENLKANVSDANSVIKQLSNIQRELMGNTNPSGVRNDLLDQRDRLLGQLSEIVEIKVNYKSHGEIEILAGTEGQGQLLLSGFDTKKFSVATVRDANKVFIGPLESELGTMVQISSGKIAGNLSAEYELGRSKAALDNLAQKFVDEINEVQTTGLDLDGNIGENFFSLASVSIEKKPGTDSNAQLEVFGGSSRYVNEPLNVNYNAEKDYWQLTDQNGQHLGQFKGSIQLDGFKINITGQPAIGESFIVIFSDKHAENMAVKLVDGRKLAASSYYLTTRNTNNSSNATVTTELISEELSSDLTRLNDLFVGANNSANPITFKNNGVLGELQNLDKLEDLTALKQQTKLQIATPIANLSTTSQLRVTVGNTAHAFTLGSHSSSIKNYSDLAELMNSGVIRTDVAVNGKNLTFSDLGLSAGGNATSLVISSAFLGNSDNYSELTAGELSGTSGLLIPGHADFAGLQVFTKEGVHLAGTPLSQTQIQSLISSENGFSQGAKYTASHLASGEVTSYLGAEVSRLTTRGDYTSTISSLAKSSAIDSNITVGAMPTPTARAKMTAPLKIETATGLSLNYEASQGMMAGQISVALNDKISQYGINASAYNFVELYEIPSETVQFDLKGDNFTPARINLDMSSGNIQALVNQINTYSESTGIFASKSASNALVLEQRAGNDINIEAVSISGSGSIKVRQLDQYGEVINSPQNTASPAPEISTGKYAILGGQIQFTSPSDFQLSTNDVDISVAQSEFASGFIKRTFEPEKSSTSYSFKTLKHADDASIGAAGLASVAASSSYKFEIKGDDSKSNLVAKIAGLQSEDLSGTVVAEKLASELRQNSVQAGIYGNTFSFSDGFPSNGDTLEFRLGDQKYRATLNDVPSFVIEGNNVKIDGKTYSQTEALKQIVSLSSFTISGPEDNRIRVGFTEASGGFKLYAVANDGVISGHSLRLTSNNSSSNLNAFHFDNASSAFIQGSEFDISNAANQNIAELVVGATTTSIRFENGVISPTTLAGLGINISLEQGSANTKRFLKISIPNSVADQDIRLKAIQDSSNFGIKTASTQLTLDGSGFSLSEYGNDRIKVTGSVQSLASETISIDGLSGEDLIVISTGNVRPSILGAVTSSTNKLNPREISVQVTSDDGRTVVLKDEKTGDYLGSRTLRPTNNFQFRGFDWQFDSIANKNDEFLLSTSGNRQDDASNLVRFNRLASLSETNGKGGYSQIYSNLVTDTGFKSREAEQRLETTQAIHDVALDRKSEFSGVDLDTEAARLLEQQQAYQALAKVLSTAKELVDTLLRSF